MKTNIANHKAGPIIHQALPAEFIVRVKNYKAVLNHVETDSLDSTLDGFKRDRDPEAELRVWEKIAATYQWAMIDNPGLTPAQKQDVYAVLLGLSMGSKDFSNIKNLSKEQVKKIVNRFS